jgi:hypothetical protein
LEEALRINLAIVEQRKVEIQQLELAKQKQEAEKTLGQFMCPICMMK